MFEPFAEQVTQSREIIKTALRQGQMELFTPSPRPWRQETLHNWQLPGVTRTDRERLQELPYVPPPQDRPRDQLDDPARDTRAQLIQDSVNFVEPVFIPGNAYEVARFKATPDETGIVKFNWTYLEIIDALGPFPDVINPGDPFYPERYGLFTRWHLRFSQNTFAPIGPLFAGSALDLPGHAYPELPSWIDQRFTWGLTASIAFYLVPANFALRLYCEIIALPTTGRLARIGGRLQGYTQPIFMTSTGDNVRHGW